LGNTPKGARNKPARVARPKAQRTGPPSWLKYAIGGGIAAALVAMVVFIAIDLDENPQGVADAPDGVEYFEITSADHTQESVSYAQDPPAGGPHDPQWLTCAAYDEPVRNENAVHALEHGAVWITYQPGLDAELIDALNGFARRSEIVVSPYPGLDSTIVLSTWGTQLRLDEYDRDLIDQFIRAFQNRTAPEAGATC
jgi:hypothetical protein